MNTGINGRDFYDWISTSSQIEAALERAFEHKASKDGWAKYDCILAMLQDQQLNPNFDAGIIVKRFLYHHYPTNEVTPLYQEFLHGGVNG